MNPRRNSFVPIAFVTLAWALACNGLVGNDEGVLVPPHGEAGAGGEGDPGNHGGSGAATARGGTSNSSAGAGGESGSITGGAVGSSGGVVGSNGGASASSGGKGGATSSGGKGGGGNTSGGTHGGGAGGDGGDAGSGGAGCPANAECVPGATGTEPGSCGDCNLGTRSRPRTCGSDCKWQPGSWGACTEKATCHPGATAPQSVACPCSGTKSQSRTCGTDCKWGDWKDTSSCDVSCCGQVKFCNTSAASDPDVRAMYPGRGTWCTQQDADCTHAEVDSDCGRIANDVCGGIIQKYVIEYR